jgi:tRNA G18 (ribose-2'-O)-methylase SpoU
VSISIYPDRVENPANLQRLEDVARLFDASCGEELSGRAIAVENAPGARSIYGRSPLRGDATLIVGNERRGISPRIMQLADEVVSIPTASRTVNTLNVAAAAAVAAWYVMRGSGAQPSVTQPERRLPSLLIIGDDHVEVGSTLRSAAAFGFSEVLLEDRGAGWFDGSPSVRREARAAARRHKNTLRIHRIVDDVAARYDAVIAAVPHGAGVPLSRVRLARGASHLFVLGASTDGIDSLKHASVTIATLGLAPLKCVPLRLSASIALAEIARQAGRRRAERVRPGERRPLYELAFPVGDDTDEFLDIEARELLEF